MRLALDGRLVNRPSLAKIRVTPSAMLNKRSASSAMLACPMRLPLWLTLVLLVRLDKLESFLYHFHSELGMVTTKQNNKKCTSQRRNQLTG